MIMENKYAATLKVAGRKFALTMFGLKYDCPPMPPGMKYTKRPDLPRISDVEFRIDKYDDVVFLNRLILARDEPLETNEFEAFWYEDGKLRTQVKARGVLHAIEQNWPDYFRNELPPVGDAKYMFSRLADLEITEHREKPKPRPTGEKFESGVIEFSRIGESDKYRLWDSAIWDYAHEIDWANLVEISKQVLDYENRRHEVKC